MEAKSCSAWRPFLSSSKLVRLSLQTRLPSFPAFWSIVLLLAPVLLKGEGKGEGKGDGEGGGGGEGEGDK